MRQMHDGMRCAATACGYRRVIPHRSELALSPDQDQFVAHPAVANRGGWMPGQPSRDDFAGFQLMLEKSWRAVWRSAGPGDADYMLRAWDLKEARVS